MHTIDLILLALGLGALALTLVGRVALGAFVPCCLAALAGYVGSYETARWPYEIAAVGLAFASMGIGRLLAGRST